MTEDEIAMAADAQGLSHTLAMFPLEIAAAIKLAREQAAALAAMPLAVEDAP